MKKESNKNWTTCLRLNTGDGSPRVFLLNSHFLGSVPLYETTVLFIMDCNGYVWNIFNIFKKEKNVVVPFWVKMISVILYLIAFYAYISFIA